MHILNKILEIKLLCILLLGLDINLYSIKVLYFEFGIIITATDQMPIR